MKHLWHKLVIMLMVVLALVLLPANTTHATAKMLTYHGQHTYKFTLLKSHFSIAPDKEMHMLAGMSIMAGSDLLHLKHGMEYVVAAGIGKEVFDHFSGGDVDIKDTLATVIGGLLYQAVLQLSAGK